jgi:hypothetical protein
MKLMAFAVSGLYKRQVSAQLGCALESPQPEDQNTMRTDIAECARHSHIGSGYLRLCVCFCRAECHLIYPDTLVFCTTVGQSAMNAEQMIVTAIK